MHICAQCGMREECIGCAGGVCTLPAQIPSCWWYQWEGMRESIRLFVFSIDSPDITVPE